MGLLHLLIAALAVGTALAADPCACVKPNQQIDPINSPMIFFQQPTLGGIVNGDTCNMNCDFTAKLDVDDPAFGLQIQVVVTKLGDSTLTVDGMSETVIITSNTPSGFLAPLSYGDSINITFTEGSPTFLAEFMITVQKVKGRAQPPVSKPPVVTTTTAPFDPKFTHNPRLVANDIMFVFDLSSDKLDKYTKFATDIINELSINPKAVENKEPEDCETGSRLSNIGLSSITGFTTYTSPHWTASATQAIGNIGAMFQIGSGKFIMTPLADEFIYGFDRMPGVPDAKAYTLCKNRGKILVLLTSSSPDEYDLTHPQTTDPLHLDFLGEGVHQILVQSGMGTKDMDYYNLAQGNNRWNFFELTGTNKDVETFFNTYLVDTSDTMTCQQKAKTAFPIGEDGDGTPGTAPVVTVSIPPYYNGKQSKEGGSGVETEGKWEVKQHYCNFQDTTVQLVRHSSLSGVADKVKVCLKVFYDLETGQDFVRILSGDPKNGQKEVVRLTGSDVSGTYFELEDAVGTIVFSSDEKNIYDGFHAEITRGPCP